MQKYIPLVCLLLLTLLVASCGPRRPENMPDTAPCTITVLKDGVPVPDLAVYVYREGGNGAMSIRGTTDSGGVAKIRSAWGVYQTNGAPVGKNKIVLMQSFDVPGTLSSEELEKLSPREQAAYEVRIAKETDKLRPFAKELWAPDTTPLEVDVQAGTGATLTVDVNEYQ